MTLLVSKISYRGTSGSACWEGRCVDDPAGFEEFLREVVGPRVRDTGTSFEDELRGLATTGMDSAFIEKFLDAVPAVEPWEIGEALAECALDHDSGRVVHWPWNMARDKRTPLASLPGSDLVGFLIDGPNVLLLIGEVKTSADANAPPNVMYGKSGMAWQLGRSATSLEIQHTLLKWLYVRCHEPHHRTLFKDAVSRFLNSKGKELAIAGVLIRDTSPNELDLQSRGKALATTLPGPTRVELFAWYLPIPIDKWPDLVKEAAE